VLPINDRTRIVAEPTGGIGIPFTVEEHIGEPDERQRFIFWSRELNDTIADSYSASMNLRHSSFYIDRVRQNCATHGDLAVSFYQIEIPQYLRRFFRFADDAGNIYQMLRLPMGARPSAEMLQIVTECLVGDPRRVVPKFSTRNVTHDVWIDGFRIAGSTLAVQAAHEAILMTSAAANATWKAPPAIATRYTFIGIDFDHEACSLNVARRTLDKLPATCPTSCSVEELHRTVSRLIFCAGALRIPLACFYLAIKWTNRQLHCRNNNNNKRGLFELRDVSPSVRASIDEWLRRVRKPLVLKPGDMIDRGYDVLYTDASTFGWGAVLFAGDGDVAIIGSRWPDDQRATSENIGTLEALALRLALEKFAARLMAHKNVEIRVDNTSVQAAVGRGITRAEELNKAIAPALDWLARHDFYYTCTWIASKENFADAPSRNQQVTFTGAVGPVIYASRGGAGSVSRRESLPDHQQKQIALREPRE
jgi:hypothetical protein